jgi:hypothetical protein
MLNGGLNGQVCNFKSDTPGLVKYLVPETGMHHR